MDLTPPNGSGRTENPPENEVEEKNTTFAPPTGGQEEEGTEADPSFPPPGQQFAPPTGGDEEEGTEAEVDFPPPR